MSNCSRREDSLSEQHPCYRPPWFRPVHTHHTDSTLSDNHELTKNILLSRILSTQLQKIHVRKIFSNRFEKNSLLEKEIEELSPRNFSSSKSTTLWVKTRTLQRRSWWTAQSTLRAPVADSGVQRRTSNGDQERETMEDWMPEEKSSLWFIQWHFLFLLVPSRQFKFVGITLNFGCGWVRGRHLLTSGHGCLWVCVTFG